MLKGKQKFLNRVDRKLDKLVEVVVLDVFDRLQKKTPIAEGTMAANWRVLIGRADTTWDYDLTKADIGEARRRAQAAAKRAKPGDVVYIINGSPYGGLVDQRTKLVRLTHAEMHSQFPRLVRQVRRLR